MRGGTATLSARVVVYSTALATTPRECSSTKQFEILRRSETKIRDYIRRIWSAINKTNYPGNCLAGRLKFQSVPRSLVG